MKNSRNDSDKIAVAASLKLIDAPDNSPSRKAEKQRTCFLVLGMHRSGTSALTRVLSIAGAALPANIMGSNKGNEPGHWESIRLYEYHNNLLKELGSSWDDWRAIDWSNFSNRRQKEIKQEILGIIEDEFSDSALFVIKDPRICRFAEFYIDMLADAHFDIQILLPFRNPLEVSNSLKVRDEMSQPNATLLWLRHILDAEIFSRNHKRVLITYSSLLNDWKSSYQKISYLLETQNLNPINNIENQVNDFLSSDHRHHNRTDNEIIAIPMMQTWITTAYEAMIELSVNPTSKDSHSTLDQIRKEFNSAAPLLHDLDQILHTEYLARLEESNNIIASLKDQIKTQNKRIDSTQKKSNKAHNALNEQQAFSEQLKIELKATQNKIELALSSLWKKKASFSTVSRSLSQANRKNILLKTSLKYLEKENHIVKKELANLEERKNSELRKLSWKIEQQIKLTNTIQQSRSFRLGKTILSPFKAASLLIKNNFDSEDISQNNRFQILVWIPTHPVLFARSISFRKIVTALKVATYKRESFFDELEKHINLSTNNPANATSPILLSSEGNNLDTTLPETPKVSILIINFNGQHHLKDLLSSINNLDYKNIEIIFVDNGSTDGSIEFVSKHYPLVKIISLQTNSGFAEANNIAAELATGDLFFLINNDMKVESDCLSSLVENIRNNPDLGAISCKIRFWTKFKTLQLTTKSKDSIELDITELENSSPYYPKFFFPLGFSDEHLSDGIRTRKISKKAKLLVPTHEKIKMVRIRLRATKNDTTITISHLKDAKTIRLLKDEWKTITIKSRTDQTINSHQWVINNAGSTISIDGNVRDRGFGETDEGTKYDSPQFVDALCGGAVLINPKSIPEKSIFGSHFFAYFEDTDLSLRIRNNGYKILYNPDSVVYHKHASTSGENSPIFKYYVERNRILFYALNYPDTFWEPRYEQAQLSLNHLKHFYTNRSNSKEEAEFANKIDSIFDDWNKLIPLIKDDNFYKRKPYFPKIAVYNNHWNSLGGGEYHAAVIAEELQRFGPVNLVSENDFCISDLEKQFHIDLKFCNKKLVTPEEIHHKIESTRRYDLFINSSFSSNLQSHAKTSLYVVSFPFKLNTSTSTDHSFINTYNAFLSNSSFTASWVKKWWHKESDILYPSTPDKLNYSAEAQSKEKVILNVGRFFNGGHCKKQYELVKAFRELKQKNLIPEDWKLVLAGQVEKNHISYLNKVKKAAAGFPIEIRTNLSREELNSLYSSSMIYWHATGLSENLNKHPERAEHFGITTLEAMRHGLIPIVFNGGGQPEIVQEGKNGFLFSNQVELRDITQNLINDLTANSSKANEHRISSQKRANEFLKSHTQSKLREILKRLQFKKNHFYSLN